MLYVLTPLDARDSDYDMWKDITLPGLKAYKISGYTVNSYIITDDAGKNADVSVTLRYTKGESTEEIYETVIWKTVLENGIWKVYSGF